MAEGDGLNNGTLNRNEQPKQTSDQLSDSQKLKDFEARRQYLLESSAQDTQVCGDEICTSIIDKKSDFPFLSDHSEKKITYQTAVGLNKHQEYPQFVANVVINKVLNVQNTETIEFALKDEGLKNFLFLIANGDEELVSKIEGDVQVTKIFEELKTDLPKLKIQSGDQSLQDLKVKVGQNIKILQEVLVQKYDLKIANDEQFYKYLRASIKFQKTVDIIVKLKKAVPEDKFLEYAERIHIIQDKMNDGLFDEKQASEECEKILAEAVANTEDDELKKEYKKYKKNQEVLNQVTEKTVSNNNVSQNPSNVANEQVGSYLRYGTAAYEVASSAFAGTGFQLDGGNLKLSNDFNVKVYTGDSSNDFYIKDPYANDGVIKHVGKDELAKVAYERYLDGYVSKKIMPALKEPNEISGVKDEYLVGICKSLTGDGSRNKYRIEGDSKDILDNLANSLVADDKNYLSLNQKVFALYKYTNTNEEAADGIRRKLLNVTKGNKLTVSELLGQKTEA